MKKVVILIPLAFLLCLFAGCGLLPYVSDAEATSGQTTQQEPELSPQESSSEKPVSSSLPQNADNVENELETDSITNTGSFQGQIDNSSIEISIEKKSSHAFFLSDEAKAQFEELEVSIGDTLEIRYFINEINQNIILEIQKPDK